MRDYVIGIDVGGTKCAVSLGNERAEVLESVRFPTAGEAHEAPCGPGAGSAGAVLPSYVPGCQTGS